MALRAPDRRRLFTRTVGRVVGEINTKRKSNTDVTFRTDSTVIEIAGGESYSQSFRLYNGPKTPEILEEYELEECVYYGWFGGIAVPLTHLLHFFYGIFGNYGIAIILLTVLVRACMLPLGRKQVLNAQRMQELAPEIKKINDKYKDDMEKRAKAQRELYQKHNFNPLAGCLPMFLQIPIFIGLYRGLSVDIELRQAPLIPGIQWCSNL